MTKRIISIVLVVAIMLGIVTDYTYAADIKKDCSTKNEIIERNRNVDEIKALLEADGFQLDNEIIINEPVDLSDDGYMPAIGDQIGGSCGVFSTVYYQYSYEVNRKKGLKNADALIYSPYYVYSYLCTKNLWGIAKADAYSFVQERGCLLWNEFYNSNDECKTGFSTNVTAMRNALKTRVNHFYNYYETYKEGENYTVDEKLRMVKLLLSNGTMLSASYGSAVINSMNYQNKDVIYRIGTERPGRTGAHQVTIVGYDDNFVCDVNGDGKIAESEKGAFKVANSWGENYNNCGGYFYVLYDAVVNAESKIPCTGQEMPVSYVDFTVIREGSSIEYYLVTEQGEEIFLTPDNWKSVLGEHYYIRPDAEGNPMWSEIRNVIEQQWGITDSKILDDFNNLTKKAESDLEKYVTNNKCLPANWDEILSTTKGTRKRMFSRDDGVDDNNNFNRYGLISVKDVDVQVVGQVDYKLNNRSDYDLTFTNEGSDNVITPKTRDSITEKIEATEVFDLTELAADSKEITGKQKWKVTMTTKTPGNCTDFKFSLTDLDGNIIPTIIDSNITSNEKREMTLATNLQIGDNDYDGYITTTDLKSIAYYLRGESELNPLKKLLSDYNGDGNVDDNDIYRMLKDAYDKIYNGDTTFVKITKDEFYNLLSELKYPPLGDVTCDNILNYWDIELLQKMLKGRNYNYLQGILADTNKDGKFDEADLIKLSKETFFVDVNQNGIYTEEDLNDVLYHIAGRETLPLNQQKLVDFSGDGVVEKEEYYMLLYGYYLNMDSNPNLSRKEFYDEFLPAKGMYLGDMNQSGTIEEKDLVIFKRVMSGGAASYRYYILADVNQDLKLDAADVQLYDAQYISEIPFTYTLNTSSKTMTITGIKDKTVTVIKIPKQYAVNGELYQITAIADNAFSDCKSLEEVYLPKTVTKITSSAYAKSPFYGAGGSALMIYYEGTSKPSGYTAYWTGQKKVRYGYTMKNAEDYFYYKADHNNKTITINGVKGTWYYNTNKVVNIDDRYLVNGEEYKVTAIGNYAFYNEDSIEDVYLPAGITVIGTEAFADMYSLDYVDMQRCVHLKTIRASAFAYCENLNTVVISGSVEVIESDTVEESIFYQSQWALAVLYCDEPKVGWGRYWNYIDEQEEASTIFVGAPYNQ